ncbi:MAG: C25 family cysteine peptidase [Candidatus Sulfotelmatobacter sp.]
MQSRLFEEFVRELLREGKGIRFQARGASMSPAIRDGEMVHVKSAVPAELSMGDIALVKGERGFRLHRLVVMDAERDVYITRGDCAEQDDPAVSGEQILGVAVDKEVRVGQRNFRARFRGAGGYLLRGAARGQHVMAKVWTAATGGRLRTDAGSRAQKASRFALGVLGVLLVLLVAVYSRAQVAVDSSSSGSAEMTGNATTALLFTHTTTATGTNVLMVVGVSINITNSPTAGVTSVTLAGAGFTFAGAHNDAGDTRRVEMWYLLAPATGTHNVHVNVNVPAAGQTVGVVAGATTFTGVDQTKPLGTFVSGDGAAGGYSQLDIPGVVNGMVMDTLATGGDQTVTVGLGTQAQQWNLASGGASPPDVSGWGSTRSGAPSVPVSETFSGTSNWSLGGVGINPSSADIGVTTSVSAVPLGQNSTYIITVTNNGPSAANTVVLTDTYAATGLTLQTVATSVGTCPTTTPTITCNLGTLASGAVATITVKVSTTAAGFYPNTATVTDSGTPPDPNTGNNTYVALAPVVSVVCSTTTLSAGGTVGGVVNTYYPGTASAAKGATSISVGTPTGAAGTITNGTELLVIQMQDASINDSNTVAYGNGYTGAGFTTINNAGNYEFVTATGPIAAGVVPIKGAGPTNGLVFAYTAAAASAGKGQSTFQVVLVPQYLSASLGALVATPWNGTTGGIVALDIAGQLNLNGGSVIVDGQGFRGGAGMQLTGAAGSNADYWHVSPATYTGVAEGGVDGSKGEGVAGTPEWVEFNQTYLQTTSNYPSGTAGTDGSMARGAPGNAGGGGTDADPGANDDNAGGGGGGNGGSGGFGGDSWNSNLSTGGEGGSLFPATIDRIAMGGGGGAGTRNNSDTDNQASGGAAGGGIIFIRADSLSGNATMTANGMAAYNGTANDAGGGGGAGGTIVVLAANGGESGLTLQANGGRGGNAWQAETYTLGNRHGPGGGGGGGVVLVSGAPASVSVTAGTNGLTENPGVPYGATSGAAGTSAANATLSQVTGLQSSAVCVPDLTITKTSSGSFTRGFSGALYTITASNVSTLGATNGVVTVNDTLPIGLTPTGAVGTGWTCSTSGQTVSCTQSTSLAAGAAYQPITLSATVLQSAPATVTNTAVVGGGGEANLLNDTASNTASVISSADMSVTDAGLPSPTVAAGSNITYTQVVTNNGPSAADNATVVATIPANTTLVSLAAPAGWSCLNTTAGATGNVVCSNANMAAVSSGTFTLVVKVTAGTPNGTVIGETVSVGSSALDPNSTNNTASVSTLVGGTGANLSVTNVGSPVPVQAANDITYTQVVTNTGTTAVTGATFSETDTPAADLTFVSVTPPAGWTCTGFPGAACTNPSVGAGVSGTFTVIYLVKTGTPNATPIVDTAMVTGTNQSYGANSAVANDVVAGAAQADLVLNAAGAPGTVIAGNSITYTETVTNLGPAAATAASFTEATPANTTYQSVLAPAGWTCTTPAVGGTGTVTCTDPSFAVGDTANIVVVLNVPSSVTVATITAPSSVTATNAVSTATASVTTNVSTVCDLTVTNTGSPSPVTAGAKITYVQTVYNHGPSNCTNATFTELNPANTTFFSVGAVTTGGGTWTCSGGPVSCTNPSVPPGSTGTITAVYTVAAGAVAGTIISDTDTGASATHDSNPADNSATVNIAVASGTQADLSVTNAGSPNPVTAGNNITYAQSLTNNGPVAANAPVFTETLPANTTAVSLTGPAGWTCGALSCTDTAAMPANTTANFTFIVTVGAAVANGSTITQTDSVTSTTGDPNGGNNSATVNLQVAGSANLSITNSANPVPVIAGNTISYTQVATNGGPSAAASATFAETTPPNTTFFSLATIPGGWTCSTPAVGAAGTISCTNPSFAPGTASFPVVLTVTAGTAAGTPVNDTVTVGSSTADPNSANNSATAADVVALATQADLVVTNAPSPNPVAAGSNITYTQSVANSGPAVATAGMTFTENTPPNTTFVSMTPPAGWTCGTLPVAGGTGAITCTDSGTLGVGPANAATFSLVLQVNSVTPSGTNITDTATATAANIVPSITTNTASATVVVGSANSVDMSIVKTGTPNPVTEGTLLTYTLTVTNNSTTTSATNVTVTDTLPSVVTYLSTNATQGSCSEAGGTVTCLLGTMANSTTATISILTIPGASGIVSNTATVTADQTDPNQANNTSTQTETITAPTRIALQSFSAHSGTDKNGASRVVLTWKTGAEAHNLGFNVYREQNGNRVRMNASLIAGSALLMSGAQPKHAGRSYAWIDAAPAVAGDAYWLEDVDVNGTRTMHGPVSVLAGLASGVAESDATASETRMLSQMNQAVPATPGSQQSHVVETWPAVTAPTASQIQKQFELAAHPAVKIYVRHEGWYRVGQPDLVKAGLDPNVDPALLHLYAEAIQQPMQITGATAGPGGFGPQAAINFYGTGIDTVFSGTRVYWLAAGEGRGARIRQLPVSSGSNQPPASYSATVELQQHTIYFSALLTTNGQNFFGALVSSTPVEQVLETPQLSAASTQTARLEVVLQGVIAAFPHDVSVVLNGTPVGDAVFTGQEQGSLSVNIPPGVLQAGSNTVTLTAQNGDYDTSLVDYIRITYPRMYVADSDQLKFTGRAGDELMVSGFTSAPAVLDITDPKRPVELTPQVISMNGQYEVAVQVPFSSTNHAASGPHTLLAVAADQIAFAGGVWPNHPSHWHSVQGGADIAMVTYGPFAEALTPLVRAHQAEGKTSAVIPINDLYDEFNFGERTPFAIRWFLQTAKQNWKRPPSYLLLNGRASLDPRNYLGFGYLDLVPTRMVAASSLMTGSDDWFSDFNDSGMPTIATGRLPVSTADEATTVVGKIATYEGQSTNGPWTANALMVADKDDTENFTQDSQTVQAKLPATMQVTDVFTDTVGTTAAKTDILNAINSGQGLVNYLGHGSEEQWSGSDIFDTTSVSSLTNSSQLPVFLIMDCLNGFFQDVYAQPLGVTLLLAPNGGGVAVLASSGLNQPPPQTQLDMLVVQNALTPKGATLGDAIVKAKSQIQDADVRRTFTLFGDPAMQVKQPSANATGH